jgi:hypothetical protein
MFQDNGIFIVNILVSLGGDRDLFLSYGNGKYQRGGRLRLSLIFCMLLGIKIEPKQYVVDIKKIK